MYRLLTGLVQHLTRKEEYNVIILGLDNAGKTVSCFPPLSFSQLSYVSRRRSWRRSRRSIPLLPLASLRPSSPPRSGKTSAGSRSHRTTSSSGTSAARRISDPSGTSTFATRTRCAGYWTLGTASDVGGKVSWTGRRPRRSGSATKGMLLREEARERSAR